MAEDKDDFFEEQQPEAVEAEAETPTPEAAEPEPVAAQDGEQTGEPKAAPPAAVEEDHSRAVPVTALLDERDKRQKAERELEALRQWRAEQERRAREAQQPKPDFYEDPDKAIGHYVQPLQQQLVAQKLQTSRFFAEREYGAETVNEAFEYFEKYPEISHRFMADPSPWHSAVEYFKRQKFAQEVQDPEQWRAQERDRIRQELMQEMQTARPKSPPQSLASAPSAAGNDAPAGSNVFDELFPR